MATQRTHPQDDLESLSALFDGELEGDGARFAVRRLGHDASWRDACGRWQLAGDVLRSQATGIAARDFPQRVASAMAAGAASEDAVPAMRAASPARGRSRWVPAAAIAASMAVVALFAVRPGIEATGPEVAPAVAELGGPEAPAVAGAGAVGAPVAAEQPTPAPAPAMLASRAEPVSRPGAGAGESRADGGGDLAVEPEQIEVPELMLAGTGIPAELNSSVMKPFMPSPEIVARPWPRAVLPDTQSAGSFTAGFSDDLPARSFYPFDPLPPEPYVEGAGQAPSQAD